MKPQLFYRNVRARDHLEIFLVSAISSLLLLRFYLYATGYPQVGGGSLHIAHMLYGGLFMMASIVVMLSFLGARVQRFAAFLGGVGFGIFIDELGKFITKDNNYFFRPTIGLIYALFIILYLIFNFLGRDERLTKKEYEMNALSQFEEAVLQDLDAAEKRQIHLLLARGDSKSPITIELKALLNRIETVQPQIPGRLSRYIRAVDKQYERFWRHPKARRFIGIIFVAQGIYFIGFGVVTVFTSYANLTDLLNSQGTYASTLIVGQLAASAVAGGFAMVGATKLLHSRQEAFEWFRRALLINLFLTEFFIFSRIQFGAIPSFTVNLALLIGLRYAQHEEHRRA